EAADEAILGALRLAVLLDVALIPVAGTLGPDDLSGNLAAELGSLRGFEPDDGGGWHRFHRAQVAEALAIEVHVTNLTGGDRGGDGVTVHVVAGGGPGFFGGRGQV